MASTRSFRSGFLLVLGAVLGCFFTLAWDHSALFAERENGQPQSGSAAASNPQTELAHLLEIVPPA